MYYTYRNITKYPFLLIAFLLFIQGRRTRSSRRISGNQAVSSPSTRSTRRTKKQEQVSAKMLLN